MPIRSAQTTLDQLYAVREDLLLGKLQSYSIGDRNITLFNIQELEQIIRNYEAVVVASESGPVLADMSGPANMSGVPFRQTNYP
jgi:hypothetical protein